MNLDPPFNSLPSQPDFIESCSIKEIDLIENIRSKEIYQEIEQHLNNKNEYRKKNATKIFYLFCINYLILIMVKNLPKNIYQMYKMETMSENPQRNNYFYIINWELIYWVPNMFLPLIFGFICDYVANDMIGLKIILSTMLIPIILSQLITIIKYDSYEVKVVSRLLFSFTGETLFVTFISSLALWFNKNKQMQHICNYIAWECFARGISFLISGLIALFTNKDNSKEIDNKNFRNNAINLFCLLFLLLIFNFIIYPKTYAKSDKFFYDEIKSKYKCANRKNFLKFRFSSEQKISHLSQNKSPSKKSLKENEIFHSSHCNSLMKKITNFRFIMLGLINGILQAAFLVFQELILPLLFFDYRKKYKTNLYNNYYQNNSQFDRETFAMMGFVNAGIQIIKGIITFRFIPGFLQKTGNRNLLLTLAVITFIFAFAALSIFFQTTLQITKENTDELNTTLQYFITIVAICAISFGSGFQQSAIYTYVPILIEENFYVSAFGFFACFQSIFIVIFHSIIKSSLIERELNIENLEFEDTLWILLILMIFLIMALILVIILEFYDQSNGKELYGSNPKKGILEEKLRLSRIFSDKLSFEE